MHTRGVVIDGGSWCACRFLGCANRALPGAISATVIVIVCEPWSAPFQPIATGVLTIGLIRACLELIADTRALYATTSDHVRRQLNQAIFTWLYIEDDEVTGHRLTDEFDDLLDIQERWRAITVSQKKVGPPEGGPTDSHASLLSKPALSISEDDVLSAEQMVELGRIELPTYSMRTSRATNCAIAPCRSLDQPQTPYQHPDRSS